MNRRTLLTTMSASSAAIVAGCQGLLSGDGGDGLPDESGDGGEDGDGHEDGDENGDTLTLERAAATPGTTVALSSVPADIGDSVRGRLYDATVDDPGDDDWHPVFVDLEHEVLFVPPHPGDLMGGGEARIEIESGDGNRHYGPFDFTVEPLSPAPGTLEAAIDEFEAALIEVGETFGYGRDELLTADPLSLPPPLVGVSAALRGVAADGVENNLRAVLDGEVAMADGFEESDEGWEVAEAMMHEAGVLEVSSMVADRLTGSDETDRSERFVGASGSLDASFQFLNAPTDEAGTAGRATRKLASPRSIDEYEPEPDPMGGPLEAETIGNLHWMMTEQARFANLNIGMEKFERNGRNLCFAAIAFVPGGQFPAAVLGLLAFHEDLMIDVGEGTLPGEFVEFTLEADPRTYLEDEYDVEGRTNAGEWEAALSAESEGWTFGIGDIAGLVPAGKIARQFDEHVGELARMTDFDETVVDFLADLVTTAFGDEFESGPISISPRIYGPVDVDPDRDGDVELLNWNLRQRDQEGDVEPFAFIGEGALDGEDFAPEERYEPRAVGRSELRIDTVPDNFGGEYVSAEPIELEVLPIEVAIEDANGTRPEIIRLDPEEDQMTLSLHAVVENAVHDEDLEWRREVVAGPAIPEPTVSPGDPAAATVDLTGVDASGGQDPQYVIEVEAMTEEGLRGDREPVRRDRVTIMVTDEDEELVVEPNPGCLDLEETHQLSFTLDGRSVDLADLTWSIEGDGDGDVTTSGTFVPSAEGMVELEFWLDEDRGVNDRLAFVISEECNELYVEIRDGHSAFSHTYNCIDSHGFTGDRQESVSRIHTRKERWNTGAEIETRLEIPFVYLPELPLGEPQRVSGYAHLKAEYPDGREDSTSFGEATDLIPMTITRRIVPEGALDGSDLQVFDGEFGPYEGHGAGAVATIEGHFTGVGWYEDRCGGFLVGP